MNIYEQTLERLAARKSAPARYRLPLTGEQTAEVLLQAYESEVSERGREFRRDEATVRHAEQAARWLTVSNRPGLLLYGGLGNGKTTMMRAIALYMHTLRSVAEGRKAEFWRMDERERRATEELAARLPAPVEVSAVYLAGLGTDSSRFAELVNAPLLLIDDVGCEPDVVKHYGTETTPVADALCRRYDRQLQTIVTSNLDDESILHRYGPRITDRLDEMFDRIAYDDESYRKQS